jgi:hypothetical protein
MRQTVLHSDLNIDQCRALIAKAASPWPDYWSMALRSTFGIEHKERIISKQRAQELILAIERYGLGNYKRGIGFKLVCQISEEIGHPGTRLVCRLNDGMTLRAMVCAVLIFIMAVVVYERTGYFPPAFWFFSLVFIFMGLVMPFLLWDDDEADLIAFLIKTLNVSGLKPE